MTLTRQELKLELERLKKERHTELARVAAKYQKLKRPIIRALKRYAEMDELNKEKTNGQA